MFMKLFQANLLFLDVTGCFFNFSHKDYNHPLICTYTVCSNYFLKKVILMIRKNFFLHLSLSVISTDYVGFLL